MKKLLLALGLAICTAGSVCAADIQNAETLYREGKFAAALSEYEQLLAAYPNAPHLYYNIGNCYFKMGSTGLAAANYYRAFRLDPRDGDIRHNLSLTLQNSGERFVPAGMPEVLHKAFFWLRADELKGLLFAALWLFCTFGSVWLVKRRLGRTAVAALAVLAVLGVWYAWRSKIEKAPLAVVAAPVAELRSGPGSNFPASASVAQGHLLLLQDSKDDWYDVVVKSEGLQGWIQAQALEKI